MSELKAINAYQLTTNTEDSDVYIHNDEFGCGGDLVECYLKSEADKVIAHQKYKRCKNMALKCAAYAQIFQYKVSILDDEDNLRNYYRRKRDRMDKWGLRWFKLAKEFKMEYKNGRR